MILFRFCPYSNRMLWNAKFNVYQTVLVGAHSPPQTKKALMNTHENALPTVTSSTAIVRKIANPRITILDK